jgi:hypothetical protein
VQGLGEAAAGCAGGHQPGWLGRPDHRDQDAQPGRVQGEADHHAGWSAAEVLDLWVAYDESVVPVLPSRHPLARLYLEEAQRADHARVDAMIMRSWSHMWITRVQQRARAMKRACFICRRQAKKLGEQRMAPLPDHRMGPTPPFWSTEVDLFSPLLISGSVNRRSTGKVWGVIFMCTSTSLAHVEIGEMAVRRFMALHRAPNRFQSDQGTQLVAASKQMTTRDWSAVHEMVAKAGAEWHVVPTRGQHYNGQAESLIILLKGCLESTITNRQFSLGELGMVVAEATHMVNSRPIVRDSGDPETGGPITQLHLLRGRASVEVTRMKFDEAAVHSGGQEAVLGQVNATGLRWEDAVSQVDQDRVECGCRQHCLLGGGTITRPTGWA